jgi:hypothetical protein
MRIQYSAFLCNPERSEGSISSWRTIRMRTPLKIRDHARGVGMHMTEGIPIVDLQRVEDHSDPSLALGISENS